MYFYNPSWSVLELLYYIATPILVIIGIVGLFSLWLTKKDFMYRVERESIQKAVELTKFYAEEIIPGLEGLTSLIDGSDYEKEINKLDYKKFYNFDWEELCDLIVAVDEEAVTKKKIEEIYDLLGTALKTESEVTDENGKEIVVSFFRIGKLLNKLEYFAMNFNTNIADQDTVYASIHQTYLATVKSLHFIISYQNEDPKDKFYTNIIMLYQTWNKKDQEIKEKIEKKKLEHSQSIRTMSYQGKCLKT